MRACPLRTLPDRWVGVYSAVCVVLYFVIILLFTAAVAASWSALGW